MERNQEITKFLYKLKNGETFLAIEEDDYGINHFINEVIEVGLVKQDGAFYKLTKDGIALTANNETYTEFLAPKVVAPQSIVNHYNGHQITNSTFNQSNIDYNNSKNPTENIGTEEKKTSIIEKLSWVIGIIAGLIAIYEFYLKNLINKN